MSIKPDIKYLSLPEDDHSHIDDPAYVASTWGQQLEYPLPKKRKSRNVVTDSCYLSYYSPDDPYDNSQTLPCGKLSFQMLPQSLHINWTMSCDCAQIVFC